MLSNHKMWRWVSFFIQLSHLCNSLLRNVLKAPSWSKYSEVYKNIRKNPYWQVNDLIHRHHNITDKQDVIYLTIPTYLKTESILGAIKWDSTFPESCSLTPWPIQTFAFPGIQIHPLKASSYLSSGARGVRTISSSLGGTAKSDFSLEESLSWSKYE